MDTSHSKGARTFETTHWSLVAIAQSTDTSSTSARHALELLCKAYWYPLYSFIRHKGYSTADAQDLTQSFLAKFIETNGFATANCERGRFRSYLLGSLKHFLANEWHRVRTTKRGGGIKFLEWDSLHAEERYNLEPAGESLPESIFDREWALSLIERAKDTLRDEAVDKGKLELFEALKGSLGGEEAPREEAAKRLGLSDGAIKAAVHRLRQRYRTLLRSEIANTVSDRSEIDNELRYLISILRKV